MSRKLHRHDTMESDLTLCKDFQQVTKDEFFKMTKKERKLYNSIANMHNLPIYRRDS